MPPKSDKAIRQEVYRHLLRLLRCLDFGRNVRSRVPLLTMTQMRVLSFFTEHDVIHISAISPLLGMSLQSVNNVVHRLEALGYVRRSVNPQNRRFSDISLTAAGKELLAAFQAGQLENLQDLLAGLTPAEQADVRTALKHAVELLERAAIQQKTRRGPQP
jgi:DNA-binding MarR family transcriptional regulator